MTVDILEEYEAGTVQTTDAVTADTEKKSTPESFSSSADTVTYSVAVKEDKSVAKKSEVPIVTPNTQVETAAAVSTSASRLGKVPTISSQPAASVGKATLANVDAVETACDKCATDTAVSVATGLDIDVVRECLSYLQAKGLVALSDDGKYCNRRAVCRLKEQMTCICDNFNQ
jgi:hypothetical protein